MWELVEGGVEDLPGVGLVPVHEELKGRGYAPYVDPQQPRPRLREILPDWGTRSAGLRRIGAGGPTSSKGEALEAFEEFFRREYPAVARSLAFVAGDLDLGAELAQESFTRAFARWDRYSSAEHARRSVVRIGVNLARSRWRHDQRLSGSVEIAAPDHGPSIDDRLVLRQALTSLSARQRSAVVLVDYLGFDVAEAARILRMLPSTVRVHLVRGRRRLALVLDPQQEEELER